MIDHDGRRRHDIDRQLYGSRTGTLTDSQLHRITARDRIAMARVLERACRPSPKSQSQDVGSRRRVRELNDQADLGWTGLKQKESDMALSPSNAVHTCRTRRISYGQSCRMGSCGAVAVTRIFF